MPCTLQVPFTPCTSIVCHKPLMPYTPHMLFTCLLHPTCQSHCTCHSHLTCHSSPVCYSHPTSHSSPVCHSHSTCHLLLTCLSHPSFHSHLMDVHIAIHTSHGIHTTHSMPVPQYPSPPSSFPRLGSPGRENQQDPGLPAWRGQKSVRTRCCLASGTPREFIHPLL